MHNGTQSIAFDGLSLVIIFVHCLNKTCREGVKTPESVFLWCGAASTFDFFRVL